MTMKKLAAVAAILLVFLFCLSASADTVKTSSSSWPTSSDVVIELWTQNDTRYLSNVGTSFDLAQLGSDEYVAPRVKVYNRTSEKKTVSMSWDLDGSTVSFSDYEVAAGDWNSWTASQSTAENHYSLGTHTVTVTVNGHVAGSMTYTLTDSRQSTWPTSSDVSIQMWSQNDTSYLSNVGTSIDLSSLGSDEYVAPRVIVTNSSSSSQSMDMTWVIDNDSLTFNTITVDAGATRSVTLGQSDAEGYYGTGSHSLTVYCGGQSVGSLTWTIIEGSTETQWWNGTTFTGLLVRQDGNDNLHEYDNGATVNLSDLADGEWFTPALKIRNDSGVDSPELTVRCTLDGSTSSWDAFINRDGYTSTNTLSQRNASAGNQVGSHTAVFTVNGTEVATITWTVVDNSAEDQWWNGTTFTGLIVRKDSSSNLQEYDNGSTLNPADLGSGEWFSPTLKIRNDSGVNSPDLNVTCTLDGEASSWSTFTNKDGYTTTLTVSQSNASAGNEPGTHTAVYSVNGTEVATITWTVASVSTETQWWDGATFTGLLIRKDSSSNLQEYDNGSTLNPADLGSGEWFTPALKIRNDSGVDSPDLNVTCVLDGAASSWSTFTNKADHTNTLNVSQVNASAGNEPGAHTAVFYVNGTEVATVTWTIGGTDSWWSSVTFSGLVIRRSSDSTREEYSTGSTLSTSSLGTGEWFTPALRIDNGADVDSGELTVTCTLDGVTSSWNAFTNAVGKINTLTLSKGNASAGNQPGTHTAVFTVNGTEVATITWTVK